jgi:YkoY family integral membrane protein
MDFLHQYLGPDLQAAGFIILNLILVESLLSVDNAAVLATMVMHLPAKDRARVLRIGLVMAYILRGTCLILAAWLVTIWWLKPLGGLYLIYLAVHHFTTSQKEHDAEENADEAAAAKQGNVLYRNTIGLLGPFWATVVAVETMDLAFSLDNVFAAVAFTDNIYLVCLGVFIGILTMRLVAQGFVKLMEQYPFLQTSAFVVIGLLGLKLTVSVFTHFYPEHPFSHFLENEQTDLYFSLGTVIVFLGPILTSRLFNFPRHHDETSEKSKQVV